MGSAVAVWLRRQGDPSSRRKLLLTCSHVIRAADASGIPGYGPPRGEILCWQPGLGYASPSAFVNRQSGACPGAFVAKVSSVTPLSAGDVPDDQRRPARDWVLLDVTQLAFQDVEAVFGVSDVQDDERLDVLGYPGGASNWQDNHVVECVTSEDFRQQRLAVAGTLRLDGAAPTGPGMSGGGVFNKQGKLVGVHRSQTATDLEFGAVRAETIRAELEASGWEFVERTAPQPDAGGATNDAQGAHPFFSPRPYPWHRADALAFYMALHRTIAETSRIQEIYRQCGAGLPPLTVPAAEDVMWSEALGNLASAGALERLVSLILTNNAAGPVHPSAQNVRSAFALPKAQAAAPEMVFVDRAVLHERLDEVDAALGTQRVLLIRGGRTGGKSWSKRLVEKIASERGACSIYFDENVIATVEEMIGQLFDYLGDPGAAPPIDTTPDAWYRKVCSKLLSLGQRSGKRWWIIVDDLSLLDAPICDFVKQLGSFMSNETYRKIFRLVLIDYPIGKLPTKWRQIDVIEDTPSEADVTEGKVAEFLRICALRRSLTLPEAEASTLAGDIFADLAGNQEDAELPRLQRIHDRVKRATTKLAGRGR
ncbi:S1 family peptidase [Sorangium sp. So ce1128]